VYATGDNKEAAGLSGIKVKAIKTLVFMVSSLLASLGGVVLRFFPKRRVKKFL
jgi:ribose/xylose/arabinose/galactoside ABC-type transport system permease subunit